MHVGLTLLGERVVHKHANHVPGHHFPRIRQYQNQTVGRALGHVPLTATRWMIDGSLRQTLPVKNALPIARRGSDQPHG